MAVYVVVEVKVVPPHGPTLRPVISATRGAPPSRPPRCTRGVGGRTAGVSGAPEAQGAVVGAVAAGGSVAGPGPGPKPAAGACCAAGMVSVPLALACSSALMASKMPT